MHLSLTSSYIYKSEDCSLQDETWSFGLEDLEILCHGEGSRYLLDWIPRCPRLKLIKFEYGYGDDYKDIKIRLNHCQDLSKVSIGNIKDDTEIAQILDSCPKSLEELSIWNCTVGEHTLESVRRHFKSLTAFRLNGIGAFRDYSGASDHLGAINGPIMAEMKMTKEVLRSCPKLIHLECPRLESSVLLPEETRKKNWDYELDANWDNAPSPLGSIGLKTLKVGLLVRNSCIGEEGIQISGPIPAMEEMEKVEFSKIVSFRSPRVLKCMTMAFGLRVGITVRYWNRTTKRGGC